MRILLSFAFLAGLAGSAAAAQPGGSRLDPTVGAIAACRQIADPAQRLACFDKAAAGLTTAVEQGEVAVVTREQANTTRRSLFGFAVPDFPFFKRKSGDEELREIKTTIVSAREYGPGKHRIQVAEANGVWETTETLRRDPEAGQPVRITRGALGSYWIKIANQREVRARRVR
jgi:hypothetical protein